MAGSKRHKLKKALSPQQNSPPPPMDAEDDDLVNDLLAQLDSRDQTVQQESANVLNDMQLNAKADEIDASKKQDARSRFNARQARKAAAAAQAYAPGDPEADARLEQEANGEERTINKLCDDLGVQIHEINPDGHCLFSAVADQLAVLNIVPPAEANYATVRTAASKYIYSHPDDFVPFLPSSSGEDGVGAGDSGLMSPQDFEKYCASIRDTAVWGGEPEILALSRFYNIPIHIIQTGSPPIVVHAPAGSSSIGAASERALRISYHRRMYGLGEHYNSLRPKDRGLKQLSNGISAILSRN